MEALSFLDRDLSWGLKDVMLSFCFGKNSSHPGVLTFIITAIMVRVSNHTDC